MECLQMCKSITEWIQNNRQSSLLGAKQKNMVIRLEKLESTENVPKNSSGATSHFDHRAFSHEAAKVYANQ